MELTYIRSVNVLDEYFDEGPSHAVITLNAKDVAIIKKAQKYVKELDAYSMEIFDWRPDLKSDPEGKYEADGDQSDLIDWDGSLDSCLWHICDDGIYWKGNIKHTDINVETEKIGIEEILENYKTAITKPEVLPTLLGKLKYDTSKAILENRLGGK